MTPLQKSIADIEAKIEINAEFRRSAWVAAFRESIQILTANLEYERKVIKDAWIDGRCGLTQNANDYYTKTYEHERKD